MKVSYSLTEAPVVTNVADALRELKRLKVNAPGAVAFSVPGIESVDQARNLIELISSANGLEISYEKQPIVVQEAWRAYINQYFENSENPNLSVQKYSKDLPLHIDPPLLGPNGKELLLLRFNLINEGRGKADFFALRPGVGSNFGRKYLASSRAYNDMRSVKRGKVEDELVDPNGRFVDLRPGTLVAFRLRQRPVAHRFVTSEYPREVVQFGVEAPSALSALDQLREKMNITLC